MVVEKRSRQILSFLENVQEEVPDIYFVADDGACIGTHKIILRLFSPFLTDIITDDINTEISHISVATQGIPEGLCFLTRSTE